MTHFSRRDFVKFLGGSLGVGGVAATFVGCDLSFLGLENRESELLPWEVKPSYKDEVILAEGLEYGIFCKWGDPINKKGEMFGYNNDFIAFLPLAQKNRAVLWVNHEYPHPMFVSSSSGQQTKSKRQIDEERACVGGSLLEIVKNDSGRWEIDRQSSRNRRIDATTALPFAGGVKVRGSEKAEGTMANCAGGVTPWGTILTCEENYQDYYGDRLQGEESIERGFYGWHAAYENPPEHYGWVVEIDPENGKGKKHTALGRFAHECATTIKSKDDRVVSYSGDDSEDEHLYKFVSNPGKGFEQGELFVANTEKGKWLSLSLDKQPTLQKHFESQIDVLTYVRKAAKLLGATPLDRPEDIEIHPQTGDVYVALTNNKGDGNFHGQILKVSEKNSDHTADTFSAENFLVGGKKGGFSCPDNLVFDSGGNLWITSDISGSAIGKGPYKGFGNNALFYVPTAGKHAGRVFQVASGPIDCEMTGIQFSDDEKTLFLSVQHPGEKSESLEQLTSHWPEGGKTLPKPAVIQIYGPRLKKLIQRDLS